MFGLVSQKKYNVLLEQNNMLIKELENYRDIHLKSGFWYIQKNKDTFKCKCSNCKNITSFDIDSIPAKCPICNMKMIGLKNDPELKKINPEVEELKKENEKLKLQIRSLQVDNEGLEDSKNSYMNKYRNLCDVFREINNNLSDETNKIPDKCPDCNGDIFYDPIGHYGMCMKCGKNYDMGRIWKTLKDKKPEVPCNRCHYKNNTEEKL